MRKSPWTRYVVLLMLVLVAWCAVTAVAQDTPTPQTTAPPPEPPKGVSFWDTIKAGGIIGLVIILMSVASVALTIEHLMSIRKERLIPVRLAREVEIHIGEKHYEEARQACQRDGSLLGRILDAGLNRIGSTFGFFDMQSAMQEVSEREISKLYRKLEYLSFIAATAPLLGLLGTVTGMIASFNVIAITEGAAKPSQLASGISEALVTTCMGLIVAIITMFFVSLFRNRIDSYVAEAETIVEKVMGPFRGTTGH